jgi:hypothetical protein
MIFRCALFSPLENLVALLGLKLVSNTLVHHDCVRTEVLHDQYPFNMGKLLVTGSVTTIETPTTTLGVEPPWMTMLTEPLVSSGFKSN